MANAMDKAPGARSPANSHSGRKLGRTVLLVILAAVAAFVGTGYRSLHSVIAPGKCSPPLPTLLNDYPVDANDPRLAAASAGLGAFLAARASEDDIDSLSVAVVTPFGTVFERSYGVLRANESSPSAPVDSHSIYRIASITKMFTVLETLILREKGTLSWDDPVTKYVPHFSYPCYSWVDYLEGNNRSCSTSQQAPITLRQLASHLSGIGRDYPNVDFDTYPHVDNREKSPDTTGATQKGMLEAIASEPLIAPPYSYPIYSNTGMDLLGIANLGAEKLSDELTSAESHNDMVKRDIFEPLGLNGSFYGAPGSAHTEHLAVPKKSSELADFQFQNWTDPSGGQYSSLADLTKVMQSLLAPTQKGSVISEYVVREWLRPLHGWSDGFLEVGAPWEILKIRPGVRLYNKGGNLPGYHSQFALNPAFSYGVIVLVTGEYDDTVTLTAEAVSFFQPAFEDVLKGVVAANYAGLWTSTNGLASVSVSKDGVLCLDLLIVEDIDILRLAGDGNPATLWSTGRPGEFRIAFGRPQLNGTPNAGCEPYWISIDPFRGRGIPADLLYFVGDELVYPAAEARLKRF
ncbi:beta-lactamase/transpeptidase-like protein [Cylindrobasidium torrendii FP15055 ss-10]|uniref:Beta-lactamase/transpeptidase-like protein n=1 Tax=Cylindrobasidium torrendii FP15055 ss-10 TaxID=1314674 RepID=A0A0D7BHL7_9AGAR|nr:beta-lactamase/transpeptidase-like protein [Cylindrobasidium torrendii FP15055 ss-10]